MGIIAMPESPKKQAATPHRQVHDIHIYAYYAYMYMYMYVCIYMVELTIK